MAVTVEETSKTDLKVTLDVADLMNASAADLDSKSSKMVSI